MREWAPAKPRFPTTRSYDSEKENSPKPRELDTSHRVHSRSSSLLFKSSLQLASQLDAGHEALETVEDKEERLADLRLANSLFCYAEAKLCDCARCRKKLTHKDNKTKKRKQKRPDPVAKQGSILSKRQRSYRDQLRPSMIG